MGDNSEIFELRFKRFLHYGSEQPIYRAGDRFHRKCYTKENIPALIKLMNGEEPEKIVDLIVNVKNEDTSVWPDSLTFALAFCASQTTSRDLQNAAYKVLRQVCKTARDIILFVKFYRELKESKGGGQGFKRAVAQWYLVWMPFDLANILLHQRGYYGWTHMDVIRIAHVKPVSVEQQVLLSYVARGIKEANTKYCESTNEQVIELLEYLNTVDSFRRITNPEQAAAAIQLELHNIERVPPRLLKHQEVWNELIPNMDVKTLLDNLQRISILGFLKGSNMTVMRVLDVLNNVRKAELYKGHPIRVYIEIMTYEKAAKYCLDIAAKMNHPISKITPARKPPKLNVMVKESLTTFFYSLYKFQKPTGLRYFVAVDVRPKMFTDRCHGCMHLTPIEAASAMCLSLIRTETDNYVTVGTFLEPKGGMEILSFNKETDIQKFLFTFKEKEPKGGPSAVASAIHWAETNEKAFDVIIIISNFMIMTNGTRPAIQSYRNKMNLPNVKLVTCSLTGNIRTHKDVEGKNMLCVVGFDEHVYRLIEAFANGAF